MGPFYVIEITGEDKLVVLDQRGQYTLPGVVQGVVFQFDFNKRDTLAVRWFPHGREVPIVVDPRFGGGLPTVRDRGITVDILKKRKRAGEDERSIAEDYALTLSDVKKVLAYAA